MTRLTAFFSLRTTLLVAILAACLVPLVSYGLLSLLATRNALEQAAVAQLESVRENKKARIESYFSQIRDQVTTLSANPMTREAMARFDAAFAELGQEIGPERSNMDQSLKQFYQQQFGSTYASANGTAPELETLIPSDANVLAAQYQYISGNPNGLGEKHLLDRAPGNAPYHQVHERFHAAYRQFLESFGYYDIFLVEPRNGHIVYSVFKEIDFGTSLKTGPYSRTNFARAYTQALTLGSDHAAILVDFERYLPSYESPASFIASPIYDGESLLGVLIFQMPVGRINDVMASSSGLGESGSTYLLGADNIMRSQARGTEDNTILALRIETEASAAAARGETGNLFVESADQPTRITAYAPLEIMDVDWAIVAEIDHAEATAAVTPLRNQSLASVLAGATFGALLAFLLAIRVMRQLGADPSSLGSIAAAVASGDLGDENDAADRATGVLASMRSMQANLRNQRRKAEETQTVAEFDTQGQIIRVNELFLRALKREENGIAGASYESLAGSQVAQSPALKEIWSKLRKGERVIDQFQFQAGDGSDVWLEGSMDPVLGPDGQPIRFVQYGRDVTEEKTRIADFSGQIQAIKKSQAVIEFDLDGHVLDVNEVFLKATGYRREEVLGQHHRQFVEPDYAQTLEYKQFWSALRNGEFAEGEFPRVARDGSRLWLQATYNPVIGPAGNPIKVVKYASDITAQKALQKTINEVLSATTKAMEMIARGDLTGQLNVSFPDQFAQLSEAILTTRSQLTQVVTQIQTAATAVHSGAGEISQGNLNLSERTESQASSLEETASSMEEMTSTVRQNADNADQAHRLAQSATEEAQRGGEVVSMAVSAMEQIDQSSQEISDIIGVINDIAFQTNLLALNASVEAARAGEQGRGFAVVAGEVRNLASRCADAAKQIKELIEDSAGKVNEGSRLVNQSGESLQRIVESVDQVSRFVGEIANSSAEQSAGIEEVNNSVVRLDQLTQQNAALVEEAAAASESMRDNANNLHQLIAFFSVDGKAASATAIREPAPALAGVSRIGADLPPAANLRAVPMAIVENGDATDWSEY